MTEFDTEACGVTAPVAVVSLGGPAAGQCRAADAAGKPFFYRIDPVANASSQRFNTWLRCSDNTCSTCAAVARNVSADGACLPGALAGLSFRIIASATVQHGCFCFVFCI